MYLISWRTDNRAKIQVYKANVAYKFRLGEIHEAAELISQIITSPDKFVFIDHFLNRFPDSLWRRTTIRFGRPHPWQRGIWHDHGTTLYRH
jgi:hypothetical protein